MSPIQRLFGVVAVLATCSATSGAVTIPTVAVGNPGNAPDTVVAYDDGTSGYGSVPYTFYIATYDATNSQYVEFLNIKDPTGANTLGLWNSNMANTAWGGISFDSANASGSKFVVITGRQNHPVNGVTWYDAVRFANWLNNGEGNGDTESGAYTLLGGTPIPSNGRSITRNAGAKVFLPSENEWYKAAYFNPTTSSYFAYPTSSNSAPTASSPTALPNHANYSGIVGNLTDVGAYSGTTSPYGAFDMGGNVAQWNETSIGLGGAYRGLRGGSWIFDADNDDLVSADRDWNDPVSEISDDNSTATGFIDVGFRVASMAPISGVFGEWVGGTDSNWATNGNWLGVPGATTGTTNTDTATFNLNAPNSPLTIDAGRNLKNITFDTANVNSMTIGTTGGNALLLTAGGIIQTTSTVVNPQTINCPLVLEGDYTFTSGAINSAATLTFGGRITPGATSGVTTLTLNGIDTGNNTISGILADNGAGKLAIAMAGPGVWALSGANTFSGNTTVTGGKLILQNSAALQMSTLSLAIDNGVAFAAGLGTATLGGLSGSGKLGLQDQAATPAAVNVMIGNNAASTTYGGILSGAGSLTKLGAGTLILANSNTYTGGTTINVGTLQLGDGVSANGSIPGNVTDKATLVFANPNSQTYSGGISGPGSVAKTAAGTLVLSGANNFTGGLSVQQGTLSIPTINNVGASGPIGAGPSVSLGSMGQPVTLEYTGSTASSNMPFSLGAGGSATVQIDTAGTNLSLSGVVSGSGGATKTGGGILTLAGASTYTGGTAFNNGGLQIAGPTTISSGNIASSPIGRGALTLAAGTTLQDDGAARTLANNLVINGDVTFASAGAGNLTISPTGLTTATNVVLHNNPTFNVTNTTTIKSVIDGPNQSLTKSGAGTLIFAGANDYTGGTTISAGTLTVNAGGSLGGGPLTIMAAPGAHPMLSVLASQAVTSVTANQSGTGSATINVASPGTTLTSSGSLTASGSLNVNGSGTLEIQSAPTLAANSHIFVNNDTMRFSATTGVAAIGTGVVATVNVGSTLELAGSVSALSSAINRVNITTVAMSKGVLVSGTNQRVGQINGAGSVVVNAGSDLIADRIIQNALVIQGSAGSPAVVTIAASDASGNPLAMPSGFSLADSPMPSDPIGTGDISSADLSSIGGGSADSAALSLGSSVGSNSSPVPEPSTLLLALLAVLGVISTQFVRHYFRCQSV